MIKCPHCDKTTRQNKAGKPDAGSQRYRSMHCQRKDTPEPKQQGYPDSLRKRAAEMYVDGLARLARKSRCFSRCRYALRCAIRLFAFCYNSRQLYKQRYPSYPAHLMDFVSPPL